MKSGTDSTTELYNEGWMLRLLLDWVEAHPESDHELSLQSGARWYSGGAPAIAIQGYRGLGEGWTSAEASSGTSTLAVVTRGPYACSGCIPVRRH